MLPKIIRCFIAFALVAALYSSVYAQRTISVIGQGSAKTKPDHTIMTFVTTSEDTAVQGVYAKYDESDRKLRKMLSEIGLANESIKQRTYFLKPSYDQSGSESSPILRGYTYVSVYEIKVTNMPSLPKIADALNVFGAKNVMLESFNTSQLEGINNRAMKNALNDAKAKAIYLAQELGVSIGNVISVSQVEPVNQAEAPNEQGKKEMDATANEVKVRSTLSVVFSIQ